MAEPNAVGGDGAVIRFDVADTAGSLSYVPTGTSYTAVATGLVGPTGLTFGPAGDTTSLYVSSDGFSGTGQVDKIADATATPVLSSFVASGSGGLSFASGLAWGPDGNPYVADLAALQDIVGVRSGEVLESGLTGAFVQKFDQTNSGGPGTLSYRFPSDPVFDAADNLLTGNLGPTHPPASSGSIYRFGPTGVFDTVLVSSTDLPNTDAASGGSGVHPVGTVPHRRGRDHGGRGRQPGSRRAGTRGILTVGDLSFAPASTFAIDMNGTTAGTGYDQLVSTGSVDLGGAAPSVTVGGLTPVPGNTFTIVSAASLTGTFAGLSDGDVFTAGGQQFRINSTPTPATRTAVQALAITSDGTATFYTGKGDTFTVTGFPAPPSPRPGRCPTG